MAQPGKSFSFLDVLRFATGYWRRQPCKLAPILALLLAASAIETYLPTALADFLGAIRHEQGAAAIVQRLTVFLGAYFAQAVLFPAAYLLYNSFETRLFQQLFDDALGHVYRLSEQFFANSFTGSIISQISRARQKIEQFEDQLILRIFPTLVVLTGTLIFLAQRFPLLALLMLIYLLLMVAVSALLIFHFSGPAQGIYAAAQDGFVAQMADGIGGMAATRAYAQEAYELTRLRDRSRQLRGVNLRAYIRSNTTAFVQRLLLAGMLALLLGGGTWYLLHGQATVESMAYLTFAYMIIQSYIRDLGENIKNILTSSYDLHAVMALLRQEPERSEAGPPLTVSRGEVVFDQARFTYPGKTVPVFADLSVTIKPGERVALVGHSGSGKTTFVRLLQCLYRLQAGRILIDGQDVTQGPRAALRGSIALVPQEPLLFNRSLAENIAYGCPDAGLDAIRAAARQACIDEFITALPQGYDTLVGERGVKLSGGERQRIAIARALLADRRILILDEATSSLDSASEQAIQTALRALTHGRTAIMIAHRLSTILDADRILVFDQGRIVEQGTHQELLARLDGVYAGLFKLQSGGFIAA